MRRSTRAGRGQNPHTGFNVNKKQCTSGLDALVQAVHFAAAAAIDPDTMSQKRRWESVESQRFAVDVLTFLTTLLNAYANACAKRSERILRHIQA
jgi:hypothetical protein